MTETVFIRLQNTVGKAENAWFSIFSPFPMMFSKYIVSKGSSKHEIAT